MKTLITIATALVLSGAVTSCKKDYKCVCNRTYTDGGTTVTVHEEDYTFKDSKVRATDRCNDQESTGTSLGQPYTIDCEIQ